VAALFVILRAVITNRSRKEISSMTPEPSLPAPQPQPLPETALTGPPTPSPSPDPARSPAPAPEESLPAELGRYQIEGEIARGGIGIVLRAHDSAFHRTVALKILQQHQASPNAAQRFLEEAQVLGQLQHPGIPPVHDLGELPDGRPFFAMKLIKGRTLAELLKERPSPSHELPRFLAIFGQLCQAVAYAHSRGILHRDLKPSNVMVGAFGEVQVMDWGLAKVLGQERAPATAIEAEESSTIYTVRTSGLDLSTQAGVVMGTPAYMSPEQARGQVDELDERCDVFGLGAVLCVLLTGQPPYVGPKVEVRRQAAHAELADAYGRLERCGADAELVALAKACLAPERAQRPRQAGEVAEAMAAYQAQVQERLRRAELERAQAQVKVAEERKRRRLGLALALALLVLLAGVGAVAYWYQQERQARRAQAEGGVRLNLKEATVLGERAWTLIDNPPSWKTTLDAAVAAVQRAEAIVEQEPELVGGELAQEVAQVQARLLADERDRKLLAAFDQAREEQSLLDASGKRLKWAESYTLLKGALQKYGLPVGGSTPERAAALLRGRPPVVRRHLAAVLQECWRLAPKAGEPQQRGWLVAVLAAADGDGWRQQVRQTLAAEDWARLGHLLGQAEAARQHPSFLVGLALALPAAGPTSSVGLLRRAQQQHPGDFWVNVELASALYEGVFPRAQARPARAEELPLVQEAVVYYTTAVALRPGNAPAHHNLGLALKAQEDVKGAIASYQKALELDPKYVHAHTDLGWALYEQGDFKGAIACYKKAIDLDPKDPPAHNNLGVALYAQGDVNGAISCYRKALELDPRYAAVHNNLGNALQAQGDVKGAIACYQKALALDPRYATAYTNLGWVLHDQKDLKGAMACYRKALELDPKDARAHTNFGHALKAQGDVNGAISCYHKALALDPKDAKAHNGLGTALADQGDVKGAIAHYKKALDLDPKLVQTHTNLGNVLQAQGDLKGAIECYKRALHLAPEDAKAHNNLGWVLYNRKDLQGAMACYQKALELDPKLGTAHNNLGLALQAQGDLKGAIVCYHKALALDPKLAQAHNNLGTALADQGDVKGAIACYHKALALDPKLAQAHYNLGNALYVTKDVAGAIACYKKALALDSKLALAHNNLGLALAAQGDVKGAIACYHKALQLDPTNARAHNNLGLALEAQGDVKGAIECYTKALELEPKYAKAHCNLGHALLRQGHFAQALKALQRGHQLGSQRADWRYPSAQWVQRCQRLLDLDARLSAILAGDEQPQDSAEQLALADLCQHYKQRYHAAARFYAEAFTTKPKLSPAQEAFFRYNAACAAVLAAAGKGEDAAKLKDKERARLRQQALAWLRDNLKRYSMQLEDADAQQRAALQKTLRHWQQDADFVSVREADALDKLPEAERAPWQQLWTDVETLLKKPQPK
jgi:tetratricopeptide (TPR) repeat protein